MLKQKVQRMILSDIVEYCRQNLKSVKSAENCGTAKMTHSTQIQSAKTTILDFGGHVLQEVFAHLDFKDLSVIADVSTTFRQNAQAVISRRYKHKCFAVSNWQKTNDQKLYSVIRNFGIFLNSMDLRFNGESSQKVMEMINQCCGESSNELSLIAWKFTAELLAKMRTVMQRISTVKLDRCCWESASVVKKMFSFCAGLRIIRIDCDYVCEDAAFLNDVTFESIQNLLKINPQLKEIIMSGSRRSQITSQIFSAIVQHTLKIEKISITGMKRDASFIQCATSLKHLKALKSLKIDCQGLSLSPVIRELAAASVLLESLQIINCQPNQELFNGISGLEKLKSLILNVTENVFFSDGIFTMLGQLRQLTHLHLDAVDDLLGAELVEIIRCAPKLNKLKMRLTNQYEEVLVENEYKQIVDLVVARRKEKCLVGIEFILHFDDDDFDDDERNIINVPKELMEENKGNINISMQRVHVRDLW